LGRGRIRGRRGGRSCCSRATSLRRAARQLPAGWPGAGTVVPRVDGRLQYVCAPLRSGDESSGGTSRSKRVSVRCAPDRASARLTRSDGVSPGRRTRSPTSTRPRTSIDSASRSIGPCGFPHPGTASGERRTGSLVRRRPHASTPRRLATRSRWRSASAARARSGPSRSRCGPRQRLRARSRTC